MVTTTLSFGSVSANLIATEGNRIRVWFNRMHESADKENRLRIDYTDSEPIPKGNVGMRTFQTTANFDNFIVLPNDSGSVSTSQFQAKFKEHPPDEREERQRIVQSANWFGRP